MANRRLQALEMRFRAFRDRSLGRLLFGTGLTAKAFLRHLGGRGDLIVRTMDDHRVAVDPADHTVAYEIVRRGSWQRDQLERSVALLRRTGVLAPGRRFLDVGAHIGTQTLYAMLTGAFSGAMCFEPEPRNFAILELNMLINGLDAKVSCRRCAIGDAPGELALSLDTANRSAHSFVREIAGRNTTRVPVQTLDRVLAEAGLAAADVGLVWIDVEGFEPQVLRGASTLLERSVPLVVEVNPHLYAAGARHLTDVLAAHYDTVVDLDDTASVERPLSHLASLTRQGDFVVYSKARLPARIGAG